MAIDLGTEQGRSLGRELAARCDVVIENFRPGVADRLGIGYEAIRAQNPGVVYCSISGYGQHGPAAQRRAYAPVIHAETGLTEYGSRRREVPPMSEPISVADSLAGLEGVVGILAALLQRQQTGEGQHLDIAMTDAMFANNEWAAAEVAGGDGGKVQLFGSVRSTIVTLGDGNQVIVPGDAAINFKSWCRAFGRLDLIEDPRFASKEARDQNRDAMVETLDELVGAVPSFDELEELMARTPLAPGLIQSVEQAASTDWAADRMSIVPIDTGDGTELGVPNAPVRSSAYSPPRRGGPKPLGAGNRAVLSELLGYSDDEIDQLVAGEVLAGE